MGSKQSAEYASDRNQSRVFYKQGARIITQWFTCNVRPDEESRVTAKAAPRHGCPEWGFDITIQAERRDNPDGPWMNWCPPPEMAQFLGDLVQRLFERPWREEDSK